jgi:hypothetical protein
MKRFINSYPMVLLGEAIGGKETLTKEKRYIHLSQSFKVFSSNKSDEGIWDFYQTRRDYYKNIRIFTSFILAFLIIMSFVLSNSFIIAISVFFVSLIVYGFIGLSIKAERNYKYLWDDKSLFMEFLKLNRTETFNPINFDQYVELNKDKVVHQEPSFEEELRILKSETNRFNSLKMETVIDFFDIMRENSTNSKIFKKVQISDIDFIRFIKERFVNNSNSQLNIKMVKGDKNHIKTLFYNFYALSTQCYKEPKKNKAHLFMDLYLKSFSIFEKADYTNFKRRFAPKYSEQIQKFFNID